MSPIDVEFQRTPESEISKLDQANEADVDSKQLESTSFADANLAVVEKHAKADYTNDPTTVRPIHGLRWVLTMASLYSFALLYGLDTTIAADIQPAIVKSLGHVQKLAWIGAGFPLGSVATILPLGYAYGLFDLKRLVLVSIFTFEAGSAVCGAAPTMDVLIVGRVIAGIGGAGMYLGALNFVGVFTTLRERSLYNAMIGMIWGLGTILGPIVGGLFAQKSTWRWAFYINLVLAAIFGPILIYLSPTNQPQPKKTMRQKFAQMDWLGIILIAVVYVTYVVAMTFGGATWPWSDGRFIATITVCAVFLTIFGLTQYFSVLTKDRIFPAQFLRSRSLILLYVGTATSATATVVGAYFIPLYFQYVHQDNALKAAVRLLPFIIVLIFCIMLNGALLPIVGYYYPWYIASGVLMTIGGALMHTLDVDTSTPKIYGYTVLMAAGSGLVSQAGYVVAQAKVSARDDSAIISFMNVAQIGSIVLALTIAGSVFQNVAIHKLAVALAGQGYTLDQIKSAVAGTQSVILQQGSPEVRQLVLSALIRAMDQVFAMVIAAGALTIIVGLLMKKEKVLLPTVKL
jgi:MFS family permease